MSEYNRVYNFSAGPSVLPLPVLEKVKDDLLNYQGSGQSVMEMSHRSVYFKKIIEEAEADLRELMGIPDNYRVLFVQGGGIMQFSMVPLNLLRNSKKADYAITGSWAKKAYKEAAKYGDIKVIASSEEDNFTWVPKFGREQLRPDADYVYITSNNTIYGTRYNYVPDTGDIPLVIHAVNTSCGCTRAEYDAKPARPGESIVLRVTYKADNPGHFRKLVTVFCNTEKGMLRLMVTGEAEDK